MFQSFGIPLVRDGATLMLQGRPSVGWQGRPMIVPGDFSAAAFFVVGATIIPGSDVTIRNVGFNPTRIGLIEVMNSMGADIQVLGQREESGEPVADLRVKSAPLKGVNVGADLIPQTIDEFPILCVAAAVAEGETVISGAEELRVKESDRIATMAAELRAMGAAITEKPDGMVIRGLGRTGANGRLTASGQAQSHGDHRVAMSLAIGGLTADSRMTIADCGCVETSFPNFEAALSQLLTRGAGGL
jgi:3-phosphoshikimate 1-carboxyvinyltransferase